MKKVGRKAASILLTLCMLLTMLPVSALAVDEGTVVDTAPAETNLAEPANNGNSSSDDSLPVSTLGTDPEGDADVSVEYVDENKVARTCTDYTVVTSSDTVWSAGWYVVTDTVNLTSRVQVSGNVHLILTDGAALNAEKGGIGVTAGNSLTIYGQSAGTGTLTARAYQVRSAAAIGGNDDSGAHGDITINGGVINATGASDAAGIGGGRSATGRSGTITINGGTVKATSGGNGAGIGGGYANGADGGDITITGGNVTAVGGIWAAGIGTGFSGAGMKITITGGTVNATGGSNNTFGGAGIGAGYSTASGAALASITITGGDVTAKGGSGAAGIGSGSGTNAAVGAIEISGNAEVHATGGSDDTFGGAGIGAGGQDDCGSITISGGAKVTATGGTGSIYGGAGIGAGGKGPCDSITISDSADVTAVGGAGDTRGGAGIGAGGGINIDINIDGSYQTIPSCNSIAITGGTVDAIGSGGADGIGGNGRAEVGSVSISGGAFTANTFDGGIPEDYLADGFTLVKNENGTWGVTEDDTTTDTGVAQIGDQTYATLEQAFGAVGDQETTITLLKDIAVSAPITIGEAKNVIFDMKGHTITAGEGFSTRVFTNNGTLTITGNGTIDVTAAGASGYGAVNNFGTLNVVDGTYKNLKESNASTFYNRNGGTATFGNPTIYGGGGCIGTEVNTTTTINGGYYENETYPAVENRGNMTITAGTFKNTSCSSCDGSKWGYTVRSGESSENAYLKIEGTAADSVKVTGVQGGLAVIGGTADIYNGVYETVACDVHTTGSSAFYAGYFTGESYETAVTIYDGTFQSVSKTAVLVGNDNPPPDSGAGEASTVMIKGGTFIGGDAAKTAITVDNTDYAKGGASISGGTFSSQPSEEFFAEGFKPEQNEDGTWGVVTETTYVAQIGETNKYATLSEALNAVKDGETIKVLAPATVDMAETYVITGKTITLDLNGQTVAWDTSAKEAITVKDSGSLTIQDTSANQAGELAFTSTYTATGDSTGIYVNPNGALALQSGTISYTAAKSGRAIYVGGTCTFAMSGGTVEIAGSAKYGVYLSSNNSTNITGGKIILSDTLTGTTLYGLYVFMPADAQGLAIENLTVDASAVPVAQCAYCITGGWNSANNAPVTISGGTYTTNENTLSKAIYYSTVKNLTISGGTFNGVVDSATTITDGTFQKAVEVTDTITGGTFEGNVTAPSGKISGGKFKVVDPPYYWNLADGKSFEQKDGYYCVVDDTSGVAQIGNKKYETLEAAITAAQNGETVKLIANVTMQDGILLDKGVDVAITLDLNGFTYTVQEGASVSNRGFKINSGTLNVIDSSEEKTGEMVAVGSGTTSADGAGAYGVFRVEANGHLNVTDVTLRNSRPWGLNVKICGGTATLTNVEIISSYGGGIEVTEANLGEQSQKGQATMTNCTVTQTGYFDHCSSAVSVSGGSKLIVDGGTYTSDGVAIYVFSSGGEIEVIDGTFSGEKQVIRAEIDTSTYPEYTGGVQIKGGSYTGNLAITSPASLAISGGTFSVEISEEYCAEGFKPVKNEQDNTWGVVEDTTIFESGSGTAEDPYIIMNATQLGRFRDSVNEGTNYQGQYIKLGADIDLSGMNWTPIGTSSAFAFKGTFDGGGYVIKNLSAVNNLDYGNGFFGNIVGPTAVIKNVTFDRAYVSRYSNNNIGGNIYGVVAAYAYGTVSFENVHVKNSDLRGYGKVAPILGMAANASGTTYLKDCTVENTIVYAGYNGAGLIGLAQNTVDLDNCATTAVTGVLCDQLSPYVDLDVTVNNTYGGTQDKVQGKYLMDTTSLPGVTLYYAAWSDLYNDYYYGSLDGPCYIVGMDNHAIADGFCHNAQAQIGETKYATLADAIAAAEANATITLLSDITLAESLTIPADKTITLDLNGKTISGSTAQASNFELIRNNGNLTIKDGVGNGKITFCYTGATSDWGYYSNTISNYGTLTLESGTVENTTQALDSHIFFAIDNNSTINNANLTIKGGAVSCANYRAIRQFANSATYQNNVAISGGAIQGQIWLQSPNTNKNLGSLTISGGAITGNEGNNTGRAVYVSDAGAGSDVSALSIRIIDGIITGAVQSGVTDSEAKVFAISGGTFSEEPNADYLVEGYILKYDSESKTWGVVKDTAVAEIVGGQKYESLIEAVNVAKASGGTVRLLADVELQPVAEQDYVLMIDANQSMTLNLNGHKITAELTNTAEFNLIKNYGELTITDNSEGQKGSIEVTENGSAEKARTSIIYNVVSGKLTLEAGTLKLTGSADSKKPLYGVYSSGTTVVMNGGAIEVRRLNSYSKYSESWDVYGIYNQGNDSQTTVNGGTITVENQGRYNSAYGIYNASGTVSIHGDPNTPYIEANAFNDGIWYEHTLYGKITLYGGKYNMQTDTATGWIKSDIIIADGYEEQRNGDRTVSIVKSPVAQIGSTKYDTLEDAVAAVKSGETITLLANVTEGSGIIVPSGSNFTIDFGGHTYTVTNNLAGSQGTKTQCFQLLKGSTVTMQNGAIVADNPKITMIIQNYANLTLDDMTLDATQGTNNGVSYVMSNNCGNVTITGDTNITAKEGEVAFDVYYWPSGSYVEGVTVTVDENMTGTITGKIEYAADDTAQDADVAEKAKLNIEAGTFIGSIVTTETNHGISISGGSFSEEPKEDYLAPYYDATKGDGDTYWTVDVAADVEAIWITDTDTKAGMLSDLLDEATSGTVQLLKDVTATNVIVSDPVTLDLNGNTLTATVVAMFDGAVVDSTEGKGLLKVGVTRNDPNVTLKENNPSLLIYDSDAAGYRLYSYTFEKLRAYTTDQSGNSMGFYFQLTFENLAAWGKLNTAETTHGVIMSTVLELPNKTIMTVYFDQSTIQGVAGSIVGGAAQTGKGFWLTVTGLNKLEAGQMLKVTPTLEAAGDKLVINTEAFEYSKSADESN